MRSFANLDRIQFETQGKVIEDRPKEVDNRETLGHWEMGTVVSKKGGSPARIPSITERGSNEKQNGMTCRRPKGADFGKASKKNL